MWYGTVDGVCRDDGYHVHVFRSDFNTPGVMDINSVLFITGDRSGRIWIGTQKGVYILDKHDYSIRKVAVSELQEFPVRLMVARRNGEVWIGGCRTLYEFDKFGKLKRGYPLPSAPSMLYEDRMGRLFYSIWGGGFYCKTGNERFQTISSTMTVKSMIEDGENGHYWLLTGDKDVWNYNPNAERQDARFMKQSLMSSNGCGYFTHLVQDDTFNYLWLVADNDIYVYRRGIGNSLARVPTDSFFTPEKKIISQLYKTSDGNIWVAAFDHHSVVINLHGSDVQRFSIVPMLTYTGFQPSIVTLCRDDDGVMWYYQEANGLFLFDPHTEQVASYRDSLLARALPLSVIPYLVESRRHNSVWVMTPQTTVMLLHREGIRIVCDKKLDLATVSRSSGAVEVIYEDAERNLWIGTMKGVFCYVSTQDKLTCVSENIGDVSDFTQSLDGYVWCTVRNRGICRISPKGKWRLFPCKMDFLTLDVTTDGVLWASTGEGRILVFSSAEPTRYKDYTAQAGLNGDMVDHVKVDRFNHIWMVTPRTVREFNPRNGAVRVFAAQSAQIVLHRFLPRAVFRDDGDGNMYFGGIPGFISLKTSQRLESIPQSVTPHITDVKVLNRSIWLDANHRKTAQGIYITPHEQNLQIEFSSLDFRNAGSICYAYRLEGVDKDWVYLPAGKNTAIYNRLGKGHYTFEVKATDENGLWGSQVARFEIYRLPAWWETWWAYTIYLLMVAAVVGWIAWLYKQRLVERNRAQLANDIIQTRLPVSGMGVSEVDSQFVDRAMAIVEQNMGSGYLDVTFLSAELGMSRSTFSRKLKAVMGQTPLEFIRSIKMRHAATVLRQKTSTIQDAMMAVGYNDHKTFTQAFKDTFGKTPSEYQREWRDK